MKMRLKQRWIFRQTDVELIGDGVRVALLGLHQPVGLRKRLVLGNGGVQSEDLRLIERKDAAELVLGGGGRDAFDVHRFHLHGHMVAIQRGGIEL